MGMFSICSDGTHSMSCLLSTPGSEQAPRSQMNFLGVINRKESNKQTKHQKSASKTSLIRVFAASPDE